jgi:hypothetical protein
MGEQHLDFLPTATGLHVFWSCGVRTSHVAGVFMQIPRDLAGKSVRTALGFEFADVAIQFAGAIEPCPLGCDAASGNGVGASELDKLFARGAGVTVALRGPSPGAFSLRQPLAAFRPSRQRERARTRDRPRRLPCSARAITSPANSLSIPARPSEARTSAPTNSSRPERAQCASW